MGEEMSDEGCGTQLAERHQLTAYSVSGVVEHRLRYLASSVRAGVRHPLPTGLSELRLQMERMVCLSRKHSGLVLGSDPDYSSSIVSHEA